MNPPPPPLPQPDDDEAARQLARRVAQAMQAGDPSMRALGIRVLDVGPGSATLQMTVRPDMANALGVCHGGMVATLADSSFGVASNSRDEATVASGFSIDLLAPAQVGDLLTARCTEVSRAGRTGVYDAEVWRQDGTRIAVFRGRSHTFKGRRVLAG